jgi:hypothetical protein
VAAGCGRREDKWTVRRPPVYRAGGVVTWDGKPAADAIVTFVPQSGQNGSVSAVGRTDQQGRFQLGTFAATDGAVEGDFAVKVETIVVVATDAEGRVIEQSVMPRQYADTKTSGLSATVTKAASNQFAFEIRGPRAP